MSKNYNKIKQTRSDSIFNFVITSLAIIALVVTFYPLFFVFVASFSDPKVVNSGALLLFPRGFNVEGYVNIYHDTRIWVGYRNTIVYTIISTMLGVLACTMAGYALSRKDLPGRNLVMAYFVFTMYFSGGLIPTYIVIRELHLVDTALAIIILSTVSVYHIIITRSFFISNIPTELYEAASIDGCSNQRFFFSIVLPISKAIIAVLILFQGISHWNSYFWPMILLNDEKKYPLQLILRQILLVSQQTQNVNTGGMIDVEAAAKAKNMVEVLKYGIIVVSTLPIIIAYPFLQKYFVKGVMIGSIKG